MSHPIHDRASHLRELLAVGTPDPDDFVALAIAGERLRRALTLEESAPPDLLTVLHDYDRAIAAWPHPSPDDLTLWLERALAELELEASKAPHHRDPEALEDALWAVDEVLAVAVALVRARRAEPAVLEMLASAACAWSAERAAGLPSLWELADDLELRLGPDLEHPDAYRWTERLTATARTSLALGEQVGVRDPEVRRRVLATAYGALTRREPALTLVWPGLDELLTRMDEELLALASRPRIVAAPTRVALAASQEPRAPGEAPVVAVLADGRAVVLTLRVSYDPHRSAGAGAFHRAPRLGAVARDAVRAAFAATAQLMPQGSPPAPLDVHSFELAIEGQPDLETEIDALDGGSLGLSAALALLSAWTEQRLSSAVAATGFVTSNGDVLGVAMLAAKTSAVAALGATTRFVVSAGDAAIVRDFADAASLDVRGVSSLRDALEAASLSLEVRADYRPWLGDVAERVQRLQTMSGHVQRQDLSQYADDLETHRWLTLADRMALVLRSLDGEQLDASSRDTVERARAFASLAYTHAAEWREGATLLAEGAPASPFARALRETIRVDALIDGLPDTAPELDGASQRVTDALEQLPKHERAQIEGQLLGTLGRALLHRRLVHEALPVLERAVSSHEAHARHEMARSRIYVAMAQRMAGAPERALSTLMRATEDLERYTVPHSRVYAAITGIYLEYEMARALLDLGRARDAVVVARHALSTAQKMGGPWPRIGILRTLAWALCEVGESAESERAALRQLVGAANEGVFARIRDEGMGVATGDGEIY